MDRTEGWICKYQSNGASLYLIHTHTSTKQSVAKFGQLTIHLLFNLQLICQVVTTLLQGHLQFHLSGIEGVVAVGMAAGRIAAGCKIRQGQRGGLSEMR